MSSGRPPCLAVDMMGNDGSLLTLIRGVEAASAACPGTRYILYGDGAALEKSLSERGALREVCEVEHCEMGVEMGAHPVRAMWQGRRKSSMWKALDGVKRGRADAMTSAGNTGAMVVMGRVLLGMLSGVERPALAAVFPAMRDKLNVVLDVGASVGRHGLWLAQSAVMGSVYATLELGEEDLPVGLLGVAEEEAKGDSALRRAADLLRESGVVNFAGFVEGNDALDPDKARVFVVDGFAGNVALKMGEGIGRFVGRALRDLEGRGLRTRLGLLLLRKDLFELKERLNPSARNGAVLMGLDGCVVKSHGGTDAAGFASAIKRADLLVRMDYIEKVKGALASLMELASFPSGVEKGEGEAEEKGGGKVKGEAVEKGEEKVEGKAVEK